MSKIICNCFQVSEKTILEVINNDAKTVEDITEKTYAGGGCQRCREQIQRILDEAKK